MKSFRLDTSTSTSPSRHNKRALLIVAAVIILGIGWTTGTFDNFLWRVHLNHGDCIQNGFGAVFCGDAATRYQQRIKDAGLNP